MNLRRPRPWHDSTSADPKVMLLQEKIHSHIHTSNYFKSKIWQNVERHTSGKLTILGIDPCHSTHTKGNVQSAQANHVQSTSTAENQSRNTRKKSQTCAGHSCLMTTDGICTLKMRTATFAWRESFLRNSTSNMHEPGPDTDNDNFSFTSHPSPSRQHITNDLKIPHSCGDVETTLSILSQQHSGQCWSSMQRTSNPHLERV